MNGRTPEQQKEHEMTVLLAKQTELEKQFKLGKFEVLAVINGVAVSQGVITGLEEAYDKYHALKPITSFVQLTQNLRNEDVGALVHIVMASH